MATIINPAEVAAQWQVTIRSLWREMATELDFNPSQSFVDDALLATSRLYRQYTVAVSQLLEARKAAAEGKTWFLV